MVVSVVEDDSALRKKMERQLTAHLKAIGYDAVAFHESFGAGRLRYMRYDSVRLLLAGRGIDAVLTANLLTKESESIYVKDRGGASEGSPLGGFWERPLAPVRQTAGKPGYYLTATGYFWESNFYDVASLALLYNARSTATDVTSAQNLAQQYSRLIVADLQKNYVLTAKH